jgi:hypothetical protein
MRSIRGDTTRTMFATWMDSSHLSSGIESRFGAPVTVGISGPKDDTFSLGAWPSLAHVCIAMNDRLDGQRCSTGLGERMGISPTAATQAQVRLTVRRADDGSK